MRIIKKLELHLGHCMFVYRRCRRETLEWILVYSGSARAAAA
jgi:hypothetical protein